MDWHCIFSNPGHVLSRPDVDFWYLVWRVLIQHNGDVPGIFTSAHKLFIWSLRHVLMFTSDSIGYQDYRVLKVFRSDTMLLVRTAAEMTILTKDTL